jgi:hypothetical protein
MPKRKTSRRNDKTRKKLKIYKISGGKKEKNEKVVFLTDKISTQSNHDDQYKEIGIVHMSEAGSVNVVREFGTGLANVLGRGGFDSTIYDEIRDKTLNKLNNLIQDNQKVCNLKIDVENVKANKLFYIHLHGTLLQKGGDIQTDTSIHPDEITPDEPV